jgi:hypothetical protein
VDLEDVRLAVYRSFAETGAAPAAGTLDPAALRELHDQRHVVLGSDGEIVMAHPFASIPLGFSVMGSETLWWGGCAWDSFALPHLLPDEADVLVATRCPGCDAPLAWVVNADAPPDGDEVAHFLVPAARIWDDVVHTCGHQRLFCGEPCVEAWLERSGNERGYVMDLATLWRLAQGWYAGRLDRGYVRREPSEAKEYFRSVGLTGPFWGL